MPTLTPPLQEFFKTLGNETRIKILLLLNQTDQLDVSTISQKLKIEQSTISHNLKRLEKCRFVEVIPCGKRRIYSLNSKTIKPLFEIVNKHAQTYCRHLCCRAKNN